MLGEHMVAGHPLVTQILTAIAAAKPFVGLNDVVHRSFWPVVATAELQKGVASLNLDPKTV